MASRSLGTLTLDLIAKIGGFTAGMDQASRHADKRLREIEKRAQSFGRGIGSALRSAGAQFLAFAGVTVSVAAAVEGVKKAINLADETRDLSIQLGASTETISAFRYAAQQTGTDMDALGKGMKILAKNAADALDPKSDKASLFKALGVDVTDAAGKLKQLDVLIPEIADKFAKLENGTTKAALAQQLFGKSGLELTEFLNQGAGGLKEMTDRARELGIVIDQQTADAADKFNDDLADLKAAAGGLALQVARELLPQLDEMVRWATDFASEGDNAKKAADAIADGFRSMVEAGRDLGELIGFLGEIRALLASLEGFNIDLAKAIGADRFANFLKENLPGLYKPRLGTGPKADFSDVTHGGPDFGDVRGSADTVSGASVNDRALRDALAGLGGGGRSGGGRRTSGKSEAEKEAERQKALAEQLQESYQRLIASQEEQIALFGDTTEAARVRYETEHGELEKLAPAQKALAIANAEKLDQMREESDLQKDLDEANKRREESAAQMLDDLRSQIDLLGLSNEQQEVYNNLKFAGVSAESALGEQIAETTRQLQNAREARGIIEDTKADLKDFLVEGASDISNFGDAWDSLFDRMKARALQFLADKAIEAIFSFGSGSGSSANSFGNPFGGQMSGSSGSGGSSWLGAVASFFGSFFGGGRANGGPTQAGRMYEVAEMKRPELLLEGGRKFLIPGGDGRVVPLSAGSGGGGMTLNVNNHFPQAGRPDNRTLRQQAQWTGERVGEAMRSNGARR